MDITGTIKKTVIAAGNMFFKNMPPARVPARPERVLVFTRKSIGGIIMALPAFKALREAYRGSHLTLWTMEWNREVVGPLAYFDEVAFWDDDIVMHRDVLGLLGFVRRMRKERYDMAVLLDSFMFPFYCYLAGIPVRVGYEVDREGFALTHKVRISGAEYGRDNFLKVAEAAGAAIKGKDMHYPVKLDEAGAAHVNEILPPPFLARFPVVVGAAVGGGRNPGQVVSAKNWTEKGYALALAEMIRREGALIVFFGRGREDSARVKEVVRLMEELRPAVSCLHTVDLVDKTSITQAAAVLQMCRVLITNDSALMHLAASVGTPTVSIFGPTDPENLAPRGDMHRVVRSVLPCSPCYDRGWYRSCGSLCMEEISWKDVYKETLTALNKRPLVKACDRN